MKRSIVKKGTVIVYILVLAFAGFTIFSQEVFAQEGLTKISENVYSYVDVKNGSPQNSFGANAGIIIGEDGIVVIDTLVSSKEAKRFIRDLRAVSDKPVKYVINTHYHLDHTFGNSEFVKLGAAIISHSTCNINLRTNGESALQNAQTYGLTEGDTAGTELAFPALTFNNRMEIHAGGQKIELIYAGMSHTDGSIMVYLPDKKTLFAGDILFTNYHPFIADGNIKEWIRVLDYIMTLDVVTIIPGHGPISNKKDITDMKNYLITFDKKAKELSSKSDDIEYITSEIKKALPSKAGGEGLISSTIQMKYLKGKQ